jgi:hypothetical protein
MTITAEEVLKKGKVVTQAPTTVVPENTPQEQQENTIVTAKDVLTKGTIVNIEDASISQELEASFAQRTAKNAEDRLEEVKMVFGESLKVPKTLEEELKRPDISDVLQVGLGNAAGLVMDVTSDLVMSGLSNVADFTVDLFVPEGTQEKVKQKFIEGVNWVTSSDAGQAALEAAKQGAESYNAWKAENPVAAAKFESAVEIGMFTAPKVKRAAMPPSTKVVPPAHVRAANVAQEQVEKLKTYFNNKADAKFKEENLEAAYSYVMPIKVDEGRLNDVTPRTLFRSAKINPNPLEADAIEWTSSLAKLDPKKGMLHNYKVINDANLKEAQLLRIYLNRKGRDIVLSKDTILSRLDQQVNRIIQESPLANTTDAQAQINKLRENVYRLVTNQKSTNPSGILDLRQEVDTWLEKNFKFFTKEQPVWLDDIGKSMRNELNNIINDAMPDDFVKDSLRRQHLGYTAMRGLGPKAVKDVEAGYNSHVKNLVKVLGDQVRVSRLVGYSALGAAGFSAAMGFMPYVAGATFSTGMGYYLYRGVKSPEMARGIAYALDLTNKAIGATKNPQMLQELRLGRSALLEVMKLPMEEQPKDEDERVQP